MIARNVRRLTIALASVAVVAGFSCANANELASTLSQLPDHRTSTLSQLPDDRTKSHYGDAFRSASLKPNAVLAPRGNVPLTTSILKGSASCGDGLLDSGEQCDDGNATGGDGCSATCLIEAGADCTLPVPPVQPVTNGSFEEGLPPWTATAGPGGDPFNVDNPFGDIGQVGETYLVIFGSGGVPDVSTLQQASITIPTTATTLSFEFFGASAATVGCDADGGADNAVFRARIDGVTIFDTSTTPANECDLSGSLWAFPQAILIDGSGAAPDFADGGLHTLTFEREIVAPTANNTNFFIDDVQIDAVIVPPIPSSCFVGVCGDSILSSGETCDDGNTTGGDGCSASCTIEEDTHACVGGTTALDCLTDGDCTTATLSMTDDVADGGLEGGSPNLDWTAAGTCPGCVIENFEPICSEAFCLVDRARDGAWFAWFGGIAFDPGAAGPNLQSLSQDVTISSSATDVTFDLDTQCSSASDTLVVDIDGTPIATITCDVSLPGYVPQSFPIPGALADDGMHTLTFTGTNLCSEFVTDPNCQSNFFVDNIAIKYGVSRPADPSVCAELDPICVGGTGFSGIEKFEAGIPAAWATFQLGTIPSGTNNWTTTDDTDYVDADGSGCGGVNANWAGGSTIDAASGEAACADSDGSVEANGPDIQPDGTPNCGTAPPLDPSSDCQQRAYLCTPLIDPFAITNGTLSFNVDYQTASQNACDPNNPPDGGCPSEALQLLVGTLPPNVFTIGVYEGSLSYLFDHKSASLDISDERVLSLDFNALINPALTAPEPPLEDPFYVCFHYAGVYSWYAQIDNVALRAQSCTAGDNDFDGIPDDVDPDDDNDGMSDEFEIANMLDPFDPDDADDDNDGDGLTNLEEFNISPDLDPNNPDTDGDFIGDANDRLPLTPSNNCTTNDGTNATLVGATISEQQTTCASKESVDVSGSTNVGIDGDLRLISEKVSLTDMSVTDNGRLEVMNADPCPACPPPPPPTVFVTSQTYDGDLNGLSGGDAKCQARANAAGLGGTWTAWLSTVQGASSAVVRLSDAGALGPFRRTDGVIVAQDLIDLIDASLAAPINLDENGLTRSSKVWTGTAATGTGTGVDCGNWNSASPNGGGRVGDTTETDGNWTASNHQLCTTLHSLYCFANPGTP